MRTCVYLKWISNRTLLKQFEVATKGICLNRKVRAASGIMIDADKTHSVDIVCKEKIFREIKEGLRQKLVYN